MLLHLLDILLMGNAKLRLVTQAPPLKSAASGLKCSHALNATLL